MKLKPEIRSMEILNTLFRLGVVFAIYGFIWAFIELGIKLLRSGQPESTVEHYLIKGIKYLLLCVVAFLLTLENGSDVDFYSFGMSGLVLVLYFLGKLDKAQQRQVSIYDESFCCSIKNLQYLGRNKCNHHSYYRLHLTFFLS